MWAEAANPRKGQNTVSTFVKHFYFKWRKETFCQDELDGPEAEIAEDDRVAMLTKVQALYDHAVQTGISSEAVLKPLRDQVGAYKKPDHKTSNSEKETSYALLAQAKGREPRNSGAGTLRRHEWMQG